MTSPTPARTTKTAARAKPERSGEGFPRSSSGGEPA